MRKVTKKVMQTKRSNFEKINFEGGRAPSLPSEALNEYCMTSANTYTYKGTSMNPAMIEECYNPNPNVFSLNPITMKWDDQKNVQTGRDDSTTQEVMIKAIRACFECQFNKLYLLALSVQPAKAEILVEAFFEFLLQQVKSGKRASLDLQKPKVLFSMALSFFEKGTSHQDAYPHNSRI